MLPGTPWLGQSLKTSYNLQLLSSNILAMPDPSLTRAGRSVFTWADTEVKQAIR